MRHTPLMAWKSLDLPIAGKDKKSLYLLGFDKGNQ